MRSPTCRPDGRRDKRDPDLCLAVLPCGVGRGDRDSSFSRFAHTVCGPAFRINGQQDLQWTGISCIRSPHPNRALSVDAPLSSGAVVARTLGIVHRNTVTPYVSVGICSHWKAHVTRTGLVTAENANPSRRCPLGLSHTVVSI